MAKQNTGLGRGLGALIPTAQHETKPVVSPKVEEETRNEAREPENSAAIESKEQVPEETSPETVPAVKKPIEDIIVSVLGKSADSEEEQSGDKAQQSTMRELPIDSIIANENQPRFNFKQDELTELAASIEKNGVLQPIMVRPIEGGYQIIAGERRWRASKMAGKLTIPAYIKEADENEMLEFGLVENLQRSDLNPIEAAVGYRKLMKQENLTQAGLADLLKKGRSTIANTLRLLELPEDLQKMIYEEKLTEGHARAIQGVPTEEGRKALAEKVTEKQLSVRETENLARLMAGRAEAAEGEAVEKAPTPKSFKMVARALKIKFETSVKVKSSGGKNKIEIEFKDEEELARIYAAITGEVL